MAPVYSVFGAAALACALLLSCANSAVHCTLSGEEEGQCRAGCTPIGDTSRAACAEYKQVATNFSNASLSSFLPFNYAEAAFCACSLLPSASQSRASACVRNKLHNWTFRAQVPSLFNDSYRATLLALKQAHCKATPLFEQRETMFEQQTMSRAELVQHNTSDIVWCDAAYYNFLDSTGFPARLYEMHAAAYSECCCPHGPAPLFSWALITRLGFALSYVCDIEILSIEMFGKCGCQGW